MTQLKFMFQPLTKIKQKAVTLIDLPVVTVIIGILAVVRFVTYNGYIGEVRLHTEDLL